MSRPALVFIGFMGAGKTTAARELDPDAVDVDALIAAEDGRSTSEIFAEVGEAGYRQVEATACLEALGKASDVGAGEGDAAAGGIAGGPFSRVISLGGGAVLTESVREALRDHIVVWLDVDVATTWQRVRAQPLSVEQRPLARDRDEFERLHAERQDLYASLADAVFTAPARGTIARARPVLEHLAQLPRGTRMLWAASGVGGGTGGGSAASGAAAGAREYPVYVGPGLLGPEGFQIEGNGISWPCEGRRFVVTDENVAAALGVADAHVIPAGEESKTLATAGEILTAMATAGLTRGDHVVALGGGVVGDLAGFCAATYQRGIPVVQIPTTVVGQVDSAYGGKTGVDLPEAKNYVGAYHQPAAVIADTRTLLSLSAAELAAGFVEALKTGLLAGGRLWDAVREIPPGDARALADNRAVVFECARFKCGVVRADERDGGLRQILNLGHTVGHALETATGYARYRHGEAIGLGLLAALRLSGAADLRAEVREILVRWGLPVRIEPTGAAPGAAEPAAEPPTPAQIQQLIARDKKRLGDQTPFVLLERPGEPRFGQTVAPEALLDAIEELYR
ncbi:MAG TPA: bifunctional shikimate kinase/3-dehydroquinate synthase [Solirubrobacterales bacterium]|nr:bifunctional shikimate kinase/3-dehydroquinate synthase [Solirubrobacterales bacterium]